MRPNNAFDIDTYLNTKRAMVEEALRNLFPEGREEPEVLYRAMRYSLLAGGKRIRPILCIASAESVGGDAETVLPAACALECIHTYSLIHDDLPAMDNDDLRRGKPASHRVFGEALAILAGDALLTEAFAILADHRRMAGVPPETLLMVTREIAAATGAAGMVGGQVMDVTSAGTPGTDDLLVEMHRRKTGALIRVSVTTGALLCSAAPDVIVALRSYGEHLGLAFQIADDILNVTGEKAEIGKATGTDQRLGKVTYPALMGLDRARAHLAEHIAAAVASLSLLGERAAPLRDIATFIGERRS
ncbi:MAG: polyprenyl synthetase family protein [Syntrophales bacterium]|nr:polyprenyl synthetase family protein [Syntrophales bacterium]